MRLSIKENRNYINFKGIVLVDGVKINNVFIADEEQGYVEHYVTDAAGKKYLTTNLAGWEEAAWKRTYGKVEIIFGVDDNRRIDVDGREQLLIELRRVAAQWDMTPEELVTVGAQILGV